MPGPLASRLPAGLRPVGPLWRGASVLIALGVLAPVSQQALHEAWTGAGYHFA